MNRHSNSHAIFFLERLESNLKIEIRLIKKAFKKYLFVYIVHIYIFVQICIFCVCLQKIFA